MYFSTEGPHESSSHSVCICNKHKTEQSEYPCFLLFTTYVVPIMTCKNVRMYKHMAAMYGYEYIKQQIDILMRITILSFNTLVFLQKNTTSSPSAPFSQEASTQTGVCTNIHALDSRYFQCSSFKTKTTTPNQPLESCVSLLR